MKDDAEHVEAKTRQEWRRWLEKNHGQTEGVWLVTYKKSTGIGDLDYARAVEEALCFGWIDSRPGKVDNQRSKLWMSPRKPRSAWSRLNKQRVARLQQQGLMAEAGLRMVDLAKRSGTWHALDEVEAMKLPPDFAAALQANKPAEKHFHAFPPSAKKGILQWIASAKRAETRARRIAQSVELAGRNIPANSWPRV